jgi:glycerol uptake facilitator-like aquaporin
VIGAGLFVAVLIGSPISGGASNPARALAPMLLSGRHAGLLLYVIGPIVGGIIATLIFSLFFVED